MAITFHAYQDIFAPAIVEVWNDAMKEEYGFFPLTVDRLRRHYYSSKRFNAENLLIAKDGANTTGFIHYDLVDVPGYDRAGVICALAVRHEFRHRGIGDKLLSKAIDHFHNLRVRFIDAAGAWPYSSFYATLIDGSERAGINNNNKAASWLLNNYYFYPERASYTMVKSLTGCPLYNILPQNVYIQSRHGKTTWLDHAFRDLELYDHELIDHDGKILSRCIFSRMDGISDYSSRERYSIFGVSTPTEYQGLGYATVNLKLLSNKLISEGIDELELHVYQDNLPAVKLYNRLGFKEIGETVIMRRY